MAGKWSRKKLQRSVSQSSFLRQTCRLSELKIMIGNSSTEIQQVNRSGSSSLLHQQSAKCFGGFQRWTLVFRWIILNDLLLKILVTLQNWLTWARSSDDNNQRYNYTEHLESKSRLTASNLEIWYNSIAIFCSKKVDLLWFSIDLVKNCLRDNESKSNMRWR